MSKSSKPAQSGLGTVRRDWSISSVNQLPRSSQEIHWSPTPPNLVQPAARKLTGAEQRLKDIQDALAGCSSTVPPLGEQGQNKRASPSENAATLPPTKRARQLPPDWHKNDILSKPSLSRQPVPANNKKSTHQDFAPSSLGKQKIAPVFLSQEQTQILKLVQDGNSVFYTGSAGTGKSVLLREIIKALKKKHDKAQDAVAITASTGIAACNIGGVTIHSFAGIGLGIEPADDLAVKIKRNKKASTRWARTKVLIIDEGWQSSIY
ncbi:hypothetical protein BYT27DRAFT_6810479 [Phlegmacium glaucopus]|nr:hypothetical protein BYT27DRAFT_6810479 [Phlegmacium glaucopus]